LLEGEAKPVRQPQRRLNPLILDVVKKEVSKLLQAGIIYPISDSQWVSPVQVVQNKSPQELKIVGEFVLTIGDLTKPLEKINFHYLSLIKC
jgi:hypothetical protein